MHISSMLLHRETVSAVVQARHDAAEDQHDTRTYSQRYFVCKEHWKPGGPIFFYLGNEADVLLCAAWTNHVLMRTGDVSVLTRLLLSLCVGT